MNILLIHGQNHKGTTYNMGRLLAKKLTFDNNIIEFFLPRDLNHFCVGCFSCIENEEHCPFWEEKKKIINAMESSDIFIFTTPNYCLAPSGAMKSFLDLLFDLWMVHKPKEWMFKKRAVILTASAGASCKKVINGIKTSLFYWGIPYIKGFGMAVQAKNWDTVNSKKKEKIDKKLSKIAKGLNTKNDPHVGIKTKFIFNIMKKMHSASWDSSPTEKQYWSDYGWLKKSRPWKK